MLRVERQIEALVADMHGVAAVPRLAFPTDVPAKQLGQQSGRAVRIAHGQVHMFDKGSGHGHGSFRVGCHACDIYKVKLD